MATLGDPLMDLGTSLGYWVEAGDPPELRALGLGITALPGNPSRAELVERYVAASARDVEPLSWFEALALWKAAIFCEAIYGRYVRGELGAEDTRAARFEHGVPYLAEAAAEAIGAARA